MLRRFSANRLFEAVVIILTNILSVLAFDGTIALARTAVGIAQSGLDALHDGVQGGMRDALLFMAKGVNSIVNAIPFVIKKIEFGTSLSATEGGDITLLVEYSFCGKDHSIEFGFNFSSAGDVLVEFCKEIARVCLGLKKSGSSGRSIDGMDIDDDDDIDGHLTVEELEAIEQQMQDVEQSMQEEINEDRHHYQHAQIELKKELLDAQYASAKLRHVS